MKGKFINQKSNSNYRKVYEAIWDIKNIEDFFKSKSLPETVKLNDCTFINNVGRFIKNHLEFIKENNGNTIFSPYYDRLIQLKTFIQTES